MEWNVDMRQICSDETDPTDQERQDASKYSMSYCMERVFEEFRCFAIAIWRLARLLTLTLSIYFFA